MLKYVRPGMSDRTDIIIKDIDIVKSSILGVDNRISNVETSLNRHAEILVERAATDRQMYSELHRMNDILQKNTDSLLEHMRRTDLNEMAIKELKDISSSVRERLEPIERVHIEKVGAAKLWKKIGITAGVLASIVSIVYTILSITKMTP